MNAAQARTALRCAAPMAALVLALVGCDMTRTEASYLEAATKHLDASELRGAALELQALLQEHPGSAKGRWLLGTTQLRLHDAPAARKELTRALELGWPAAEVAVPLARALLIEDPEQVLQGLEIFGDASELPDETRAELHLMRGLALLRTGEPARAAGELNEASEVAVQTPAAWTSEALLAFGRGDLGTARDRLGQVLRTQPDRAEAHAVLGDVALAQQNLDAAIGFYERAVELEPPNVTYRLALARVQLRAGRGDEAIATLKMVLDVFPEMPTANHLRATAALAMSDYAGAQAFAEKALRAAPEHAPSHYVAGAASYHLGQFERALAHLQPAAAAYSRSREFAKLLAATQVQLGLVEEAVRTAAVIDNGNPTPEDARFLRALGAAAITSGQMRAGEGLLLRAAATYPEDPETQFALGVAKLELGDESGGKALIQRALELDPDFAQAEVAAILVALRNKELGTAFDRARAFLKKNPERAAAHTLLGMVHSVRGELAEAKEALRRAIELDPESVEATSTLGQILYLEEDWEAARRLLQHAAEARPEDAAILLKLAVSESRLGNEKQAEVWLRQAIGATPDLEAPRLALARVLVATDRVGETRALLEDFASSRETTPEFDGLLATVQLRLGDHDAAVRTLERLATKRPDDAGVHRALARAHQSAGNIEAALGATQRALELDPEHAGTRFRRAALLVAVRRFDEARALVEALKSEHSGSADLADLEGAIALRDGDAESAVEAYRRAFELRETNFQAMKLARALAAADRGDEAIAMIEGWLVRYPNDVVTRTFLYEIHVAADRPALARAQLEKLVELDPNDSTTQNNLAWVLYRAKDHARALEHAERAHRIAPHDADVLDTLGRILLAVGGQDNRALEVLQEAARERPDDRALQAELAVAYIRTGQLEQAREILARVLFDGIDFPGRPQAESLHRQLSN